jgi:hypothetical protein
VPTFVQKLADETIRDGQCSHIAKVSLVLKPADDTDDNTSIPWFTQNSVLSTLTQVYSFDILKDYTEATDDVIPKASISSSDVFLPVPSYTNNVYSSETRLVIAGESYTENELGEWKEHTVFLAFKLDGASASFQSYGDVRGSLLNQFSMDHYVDPISNEDYLRVATTTWARWSFVDDEWQQTEESESIGEFSILDFKRIDFVWMNDDVANNLFRMISVHSQNAIAFIHKFDHGDCGRD